MSSATKPVLPSISKTPLAPNRQTQVLPPTLPQAANPTKPAIPEPKRPMSPRMVNLTTASALVNKGDVVDENSKVEPEFRNYQGVIDNTSIETELINNQYVPLSKITVNGERQIQYIKALNKNGQYVFINIDVDGYNTSRKSDLRLIKSNQANIVPYSIKMGAIDCAQMDVCGIAFECGPEAICVVSRNGDDLTPTESNFIMSMQDGLHSALIESEDNIMTYPIVRLSEIRIHPQQVLINTNVVTKRLRSNAYKAVGSELARTQEAINSLNASFCKFESYRNTASVSLANDVGFLEQCNTFYSENTPTCDSEKEKWRMVQLNLMRRNEAISELLRVSRQVAEIHIKLEAITSKIDGINEYCQKELVDIASKIISG